MSHEIQGIGLAFRARQCTIFKNVDIDGISRGVNMDSERDYMLR
jgi:hypothetical protein